MATEHGLIRAGTLIQIMRPRTATALAAVLSVATPAQGADDPPLHSATWVAPTCIEPGRTVPAGAPAALLGLLIPKAVEGGLRLVGNALTRAGAPRERHVWSRTNTTLYNVNYRSDSTTTAGTETVALYDESPDLDLENRCIIAVFGPRAGSVSAAPIENMIPLTEQAVMVGDQPQVAVRLRPEASQAITSRFNMARSTVFVGQLVTSSDRTAFRIVPQYVEVAGALRDRRVDRPRAVTITVSLLPPGGADEGAASVVRTFSLPRVGAREVLTRNSAEALASSWIPLPPLPDLVEARMTASATRRNDFNSLTDTINSSTDTLERQRARTAQNELEPLIVDDRDYLRAVAPYSVRADLTETTPGNAFLRRLGEFLTGNASEIAAPIAAAINPQQRATAAEEEAAAEDTLRVAAIEAAATVATAQDEGDASALRVARIQAAAACRRLKAAGYSDPACVIAP